jgi:hypothetical protein
MNTITDKINEIVAPLDDHQLAALLGISYNGAKKKRKNGSYSLSDVEVLLSEYKVMIIKR